MKYFLVSRRYIVNGDEIQSLRRLRGMTAKTVATKCGWSRSYQAKLESRGQREVDEAICRQLCQVFGLRFKVDGS